MSDHTKDLTMLLDALGRQNMPGSYEHAIFQKYGVIAAGTYSLCILDIATQSTPLVSTHHLALKFAAEHTAGVIEEEIEIRRARRYSSLTSNDTWVPAWGGAASRAAKALRDIAESLNPNSSEEHYDHEDSKEGYEEARKQGAHT